MKIRKMERVIKELQNDLRKVLDENKELRLTAEFFEKQLNDLGNEAN